MTRKQLCMHWMLAEKAAIDINLDKDYVDIEL